MAKRPERKGGLKADPATSEWLETAAKNYFALTKKQLYDAARVRVRVDLPDWLKDRLGEIAKEQGTSVNQIGAFALAWWVMLYDQDDTSMVETFDHSLKPSRAVKNDNDVDLALVIERLTNPADAPE